MRTLAAVLTILLAVFFYSCAAEEGAGTNGGDGGGVSGGGGQTVAGDPVSGDDADEVSAEAGDESPAETAAAESGDEESASVRVVSYAEEVFPIFEQKCVDCHHQNNAVKIILTDIFDPELGMINRPNSWPNSERPVLVVPGEPENSALMLKIERTDYDPKVEGNPMPWNIARLTDGELTELRVWINEGAEDDGRLRGPVRRIFGDGVSLGSRGGKCTYCHHPWEGRREPDLVNVFDPEAGAVGVPSFYGGLRIDPGASEESVVYLKSSPRDITPSLGQLMPQHFEMLDEQELSLVRRWIAQGARNN